MNEWELPQLSLPACQWLVSQIPKTYVAECIRGTFFADSIREDGPQMDAWWLELMDEVDKRFRTLGPSTIEWTQ